MFDSMAKQVIYDAETLASNDGDFVRLHHVTRALLQGQGVSNTVLKSFGMTKDNVPLAPTSTVRFFFKPWKRGDEHIHVDKYLPDVVSVWYHAECLKNETGQNDAAEFFLISLLEQSGAYSEELRRTFNFTMNQAYRRIQHLQAVSLWSGFEPEAHARRFLSLAQAELVDGNPDEAVRLVTLAVNEMRQAKHSADHRLLTARAQTVKQAARFYKTIAKQNSSSRHLRRFHLYEKLANALSAAALQRDEDTWCAKQMGLTN